MYVVAYAGFGGRLLRFLRKLTDPLFVDTERG